MEKFSDLKLNPKILKAVKEAGYEEPTPIQQKAIPAALDGKDVLGIAQTGTGKTASFTLPMINLLSRGRARARMPRSLVLCPTRELATQVAENFDIYAKNLKLKGSELLSVIGIEKGFNPSERVKLEIKYLSGDIRIINTICRIDTKNELEYYKNGGSLQYVLRNMI